MKTHLALHQHLLAGYKELAHWSLDVRNGRDAKEAKEDLVGGGGTKEKKRD